MNAPDTNGISTDELSAATGLDIKRLRKVLADLSESSILQDDQKVTAFLRLGIANQSTKRLTKASTLEDDLIKHIQEQAPDQERNTASTLHLRHTTQHFKDQRPPRPNPPDASTNPEVTGHPQPRYANPVPQHPSPDHQARNSPNHPPLGLAKRSRHPQKSADPQPRPCSPT